MSAAAAALLAGMTAAGGARGQTPAERADALLESRVGPDEPGVAAMALVDGEVVWRGARGVADLETGAPIDADTRFYLASTGKMFTAMAVLALVDREVLGLDEPVTMWHDELDYARGVTIRHLLGHLSGLPDHYDALGEDRTYSDEDVLEWLRGLAGLDFPPGEGSAYSNPGYVLLGRIVDRVTEGMFTDFLRETLFEPLGMTSTVVVDGRQGGFSRRARGYVREGDGWALRDYESTTTGAGGVYSTLHDLARWDAGLERVVDDSLLALASTPALRNDGRPTPYGWGWLAESYRPERGGVLAGREYVLAAGDLRGFRAWYQRFREPRVTIVWLTNRGEMDVEAVEALAEMFVEAAAR
ncbi:MAG TPA: serine hydrolase domain-containing protein [Gemmatimonadota bacterium]|nr:serine hydrolase domain-containing protein [Gemmatimonadota bacterium]